MKRLLLLLAIPFMLLGNVIAWLRFAWSWMFSPHKAWRIAIGYDQLFNVSANGNEDETLSSRAARAKKTGRSWGCVLCRLLDLIDKNHCDKSLGT